MTDDFNRSPYWDDYDPDKGFYRILFRPAVAVQTRELNQLQSIIKEQIDRFGRHIFKDGSLVLGGSFDIETDVRHVKVTGLANEEQYELLIGRDLTGGATGLVAYVIAGELDENTGEYVYIVRYKSSNSSDDREFSASEALSNSETGLTVTTAAASPTGPASVFAINEGVVFSSGYFVSFDFQRIILEKYSDTPSYSIGFDISESFVTAETDQTLRDNAAGTFNFAAPGADRYAIGAKLVKAPIGQESTLYTMFSDLAVIRNGVLEDSAERTEYARIYDEIAKRTYDQAGDYYVSGLGVRTREHLDTGVNEGLVPSSGLTQQEIEDLSNELSLDVEPGTAYVKGYEINNRVTRHVITDKAIDFDYVEGQIVSARTGGYIRVTEIVGCPTLNEGVVVDLYDTAEDRVTNNTKSSVSPTGAKIGEAKIKSVLYDSGVLGTDTGVLRVYLYDIQMDSAPFGDVRAIYYGPSDFFGDVILTSGSATLVETIQNTLLFDIGSEHTRTIRDDSTDPSANFIFHTTTDKNINLTDGGTVTIQITGTNQTFPYGSGFLSITEKRDFIVSVNADVSITLAGSVSGSSGTKDVTGSGTAFTNLTVGNRITIGSDDYIIESITDDTTMTVTENLVQTYTTSTIARTFYEGDVIDLTEKGSSGNTRTVEVTSPTSAVIDLQEVNGTGSVASTITHRVNVVNAREVPKVLRPNRYVVIDCSTLSTPLTDPIRLGFSDVYQIREVRKHNTTFSGPTDGTDVTSSFVLDTGQRDNQYDHGYIVPQIQLSSSDYLLVKLDHFVPNFSFADSIGYFSVDSYPVDDTQVADTSIFTYQIPRYRSSSGVEIDLRNALDFRPVKTNSAADATDVGSASVNPADSTTYFESSSGLATPVANTQIRIDFSYYLARRDVVTVDQNNVFGVVRGVPSVVPVTPTVSESVMGIANVFITPYPSLAGSFARSIGRREIGCQTDRIAHVRHTMRDITVLKERIENLETVTSLNLLEKSANDLKVVDETGLDRFKNGFFVDNFASHELGDTTNLDYRVSIDKLNKEARPYFEMDSFRYEYDPGNSSGVQITGDLISVPYTEEVLIDQPRVSTTRNIEQSVFRYIGELDILPRHDTWIDESTVDKTVQFGEDISDALEASGIKLMNTVWGSWQTYSKGVSTYTQQTQRYIPGKQRAFIDTFKETTYKQRRIGTEYQLGLEQQEQELGNFVTDVSVVPYIRPQVIKVFASGLLPNTKIYAFFDGENMTDYVSPFTPNNSLTESPIFSDFDDDTTLQSEGSTLRTDKFGVFYGELRLPATGKRFRVGTKKIILTDSPTNASDPVTAAETYFVAQGLEVQKQNTILSTQIPVVEQNQVRQTRTKAKTQLISRKVTCLAYSFLVDVPEGEEGVFLSSVDVFIESLDPNLGVWFEILEMDAGGSITQNQVPFSEVWMNRDDTRLNVSTDASTPTNVNFKSPVFLYNNTQYAFVVHTVGINPNTRFWVARLGEEDIITGETITSRRLTGTTFTTNNGLNWDIVPDVDLKIRFNRAKFTTGTAYGTASIKNRAYEFLEMTSSSASNAFTPGERVTSTEVLTLSDTSGVSLGDTINGITSTVSGEVIDITSDSKIVTDASGFEVGEDFGINNTTPAGSIDEIDVGTGRVYKVNDNDVPVLILDSSNGLFREGVTVTGASSGASDVVSSVTEFEYETQTLKPNHIKFNRTNIDFNVKSINKASPLTYAPTLSLEPHDNREYTNEKILHSRSNENLLFSGNGSNVVEVRMRTLTDYVSPVIDMSRAHSVYVHNLINDDTAGEDSLGHPNGVPQFDSSGDIDVKAGGNLDTKYISRIITLAEGQDAEDVLVYLTAYIPPNTDIPVYIKARHREDSQTIEEKEWIPLVRLGSEVSSIVDRNDFRELRYGFSDANLDNSGVFTYSVGGIDFKGYKQFQLKIGLSGSNSALVPRVKDLRSIALQV